MIPNADQELPVRLFGIPSVGREEGARWHGGFKASGHGT